MFIAQVERWCRARLPQGPEFYLHPSQSIIVVIMPLSGIEDSIIHFPFSKNII